LRKGTVGGADPHLISAIALLPTLDCEKTTHIHLLILSNKNNKKQVSFKLNLRKIISMPPRAARRFFGEPGGADIG
jgi:hypothetical protein